MIKYILVILGVWLASNLKAQKSYSSEFHDESMLPVHNLSITWHKTTMLIFPQPIQSADRGDDYILAEKVKGSENVLKVKAGQKDFEPSSLTVITTDGRFYAFNVKYAEEPPYLVLDLSKSPLYAPVHFNGVSLNSEELEAYASSIKGMSPFLHGVRTNKNDIAFRLTGIFIKYDVLFFSFNVRNSSNIPYNVASLRFFIRDKSKAKRTAVQDNETEPLYSNSWGIPEDDIGQTIVVAFPKFTIADSKNFVTELMEKGGDRNNSLKLSQRKLLKAKPLVH